MATNISWQQLLQVNAEITQHQNTITEFEQKVAENKAKKGAFAYYMQYYANVVFSFYIHEQDQVTASKYYLDLLNVQKLLLEKHQKTTDKQELEKINFQIYEIYALQNTSYRKLNSDKRAAVYGSLSANFGFCSFLFPPSAIATVPLAIAFGSLSGFEIVRMSKLRVRTNEATGRALQLQSGDKGKSKLDTAGGLSFVAAILASMLQISPIFQILSPLLLILSGTFWCVDASRACLKNPSIFNFLQLGAAFCCAVAGVVGITFVATLGTAALASSSVSLVGFAIGVASGCLHLTSAFIYKQLRDDRISQYRQVVDPNNPQQISSGISNRAESIYGHFVTSVNYKNNLLKFGKRNLVPFVTNPAYLAPMSKENWQDTLRKMPAWQHESYSMEVDTDSVSLKGTTGEVADFSHEQDRISCNFKLASPEFSDLYAAIKLAKDTYIGPQPVLTIRNCETDERSGLHMAIISKYLGIETSLSAEVENAWRESGTLEYYNKILLADFTSRSLEDLVKQYSFNKTPKPTLR